MTVQSVLRHLFFAFTLAIAGGGSAVAQTENILYTFQGFNDGFNIGGAALIVGKAGNLYGTTTNGGSDNCTGSYPGCGTIYELARPAQPSGPWVKHEIWRFQGGIDGGFPSGLLVQGGKLIGEAGTGGNGACLGGCGYIYQLTPPAASGASWTKAVHYEFPDVASACRISASDAAGDFFGVGPSTNGNGSICKITRPNQPWDAWAVANLYTFKGVPPNHAVGDGSGPFGVTFDQQGNLWGATANGGFCQQYEGGSCFGTVFKLTPSAQPGGVWNETVVYRFRPVDQNPTSGVVIDRNGAVYGTTYTEVYQLAGPAFTVIDGFPDVINNARSPTGGVILDAAGNLYGTTGAGGQFNDGTVYKLTRPQNGSGPWVQTILHSFAGGTDGFNPEVSLALGPSGGLYGFTQNGGNQGCSMGGGSVGCGVVFDVYP